MKNIMISLAALALLAGCIDRTGAPPTPAQQAARDELAVAGIEAAEAAVRLKCPSSRIELIALIASRTLFDASIGLLLEVDLQRRIVAARQETDRICGIGGYAVPTEPSPPPPPSEPHA